MKRITLLYFIIFISHLLCGQGQFNVLFLTKKIIVIQYDEGEIIHAVNGQPVSGGTYNGSTLNISQAANIGSYSISSTNDPNYSSPKLPVSIKRKSKATDFINTCIGWGYLPYYGVNGCQNEFPNQTSEHILYLALPFDLEQGKTYTIIANNAGWGGSKSSSMLFDYKTNKSLAIHVNNIGYSSEAQERFAYVYHWMGDGGSLDLSEYDNATFELVNENTNAVVFSGNMIFRASASNVETYQAETEGTTNQNFLGAEVYECNLSSYATAGTYHIRIPGIGRSNTFDISCNALRLPFEFAMKGLFNNRSGITIDKPNTNDLRPAPHNPQTTPGFAGKLKYTSSTWCGASNADASSADSAYYSNGFLGNLDDTWGWYQDAGDWDGYLLHTNVPIKLMFTYEHFENNFADGQLVIPESGNGLPDILDEARWLLRFYKRLKDETTAKGWTTGGVPGARIFGDLWGSDLGSNDIVRGSWQDTDRSWFVSGEDQLTTFVYAAMAAQFAYLLNRDNLTDPENINWQLEAINAFNWANAQYNPSYTCHEYKPAQMKNFAAAALYRLTQSNLYHNAFESSWNDFEANQELSGEAAYGAYIYTFTSNTNSTLSNILKTKLLAVSDYNLFEIGENRSCRWGGNPYMPMLVGQGTTPLFFEGLMGYQLHKVSNPLNAARALKIMFNSCDYFLGNNPLSMTWITGLGEKSPTGILSLDSWATGNGEVKPGIVPYGPWRKQTPNVMGPWDPQWPHQFAYPDIDLWPGHERWFEQRHSGLGAEYTIHQNNVNAACIYGALSGEYNCTNIVPTSQIDFEPVNKIDIYPNPNSGFFTIKGELEKYSLTIINNIGQTIMTIPSEGNQFLVNIDHLGTGLFYLKIVANNGVVTMKHIVKM